MRFTTGQEAVGLRITFDRESPFGPNTRVIQYGVPLHVHAVFNESNPSGNFYPYSCEIMIGGQTLRSGGGGEIEVIRTS